MRRLLSLVILPTVLMAAAACSDDDGGASGGSGGQADTESTAAGATSTTFAPPTTFMPDCSVMPPVAEISEAVGVPLTDGQVVETGTCQFVGLNDQSLSVFLGALSDPGDQVSFHDLQNSLGTPTALSDPAGAMIGLDGTVFLTKDGVVYTALTMVTGGPASEQGNLSVAVLKRWLGV